MVMKYQTRGYTKFTRKKRVGMENAVWRDHSTGYRMGTIKLKNMMEEKNRRIEGAMNGKEQWKNKKQKKRKKKGTRKE